MTFKRIFTIHCSHPGEGIGLIFTIFPLKKSKIASSENLAKTGQEVSKKLFENVNS